MKLPVLFALLLLGGCGTLTPMEDLERQALLTGDWSAVERREQWLERRRGGHEVSCPVGYMGYCMERSRELRCSCIPRDSFRAALSMD